MRRRRRRQQWTWEAMLRGSNRPGHMFAAGAACTVFLLLGNHFINGWLIKCGLTIFAWEWSCTPDVDCAAQRKPNPKTEFFWTLVCLVWRPYSWLVPHRSRWSHSLLFGLPLRFLYITSIPLGLGTVLFTATQGESPAIALSFVSLQDFTWLFAGAAIADVVHLAKDGYSIVEMLEGKG
ncbi:MAG: DUF2227 family putative metal-binding protein [Cyanobacteria bacterium J06559_3]